MSPSGNYRPVWRQRIRARIAVGPCLFFPRQKEQETSNKMLYLSLCNCIPNFYYLSFGKNTAPTIFEKGEGALCHLILRPSTLLQLLTPVNSAWASGHCVLISFLGAVVLLLPGPQCKACRGDSTTLYYLPPWLPTPSQALMWLTGRKQDMGGQSTYNL